MNTNYFTNPELSKRLEEIGVESQFDYYWVNRGEYYTLQGGLDDGIYMIDGGLWDYSEQTYHFSDILLPNNAKKIWGEDAENTGNHGSCCDDHSNTWPTKTEDLLSLLQYDQDWQEWLLEELGNLFEKPKLLKKSL